MLVRCQRASHWTAWELLFDLYCDSGAILRIGADEPSITVRERVSQGMRYSQCCYYFMEATRFKLLLRAHTRLPPFFSSFLSTRQAKLPSNASFASVWPAATPASRSRFDAQRR